MGHDRGALVAVRRGAQHSLHRHARAVDRARQPDACTCRPRRSRPLPPRTHSACMSTVATPPADAQTYSPTIARSLAKTQKPPLHGQHWMAITGKPLAATAGAMIFAARRQCRRRGLRDDRGDVHDVGRAALGRRDAGADLRSAHEEGDRDQRARHRAHRRDARVLPRQGLRVSARLRPARGGHAGHAGRPHADAGGVRHALAGRGARARDRTRRRLSDRRRDRRPDRALEGQAQGVAVLEAGDAAAPRRGARGPARRRDLPPARPRGDAAQAGRGGEAGARRRQVAQGRDPGGVRPLLPRRHRAGVRARRAGTGRPDHARRPRAVAAARRGAAAARTIAASTSTSSTSGRRARRCCSR